MSENEAACGERRLIGTGDILPHVVHQAGLSTLHKDLRLLGVKETAVFVFLENPSSDQDPGDPD